LIKSQIDENRERYVDISHRIHENPEIGNTEVFASSLLIDTLLERGFEVARDIAGHPTGFIAKKSLGLEGGPNIAFMCEYDALAGLGHACGHNLIGTASVAAAIALVETSGVSAGTVYVFGCPAEEGGVDNASAKATYAAAGLFDNIDAAMQIHAAGSNILTTPHLAIDSVNVEFFGKETHAASAPHEGINALDAMILFFSGVGLMRQQLKDEARVHGVITDGGEAANIIPRHTAAKFYVRAETLEYVRELYRRIENIAKGAAIATGCEYSVERYRNTVESFLLCPELDNVYLEEATGLGMHFVDPPFGKGSSDVGNVTQVTATIQPYLKIGGSDLMAHTVEFREAAVSPEADEALILGAKALSLTALRLFNDPALLGSIREAHAARIAAAKSESNA
jgi:amidohydrolase